MTTTGCDVGGLPESSLRLFLRPPGSLTDEERRAIRALVDEVADEFVPSLASRSSTTQSDLVASERTGVEAYVTEMLRQHLLVVPTPQGDLAGFLSFRWGHIHPLFSDRGPSLYVSTVAVAPTSRRHGVARLLYTALLGLPHDVSADTVPPHLAGSTAPPAFVLLRTWSSNAGHLRLLERLGFSICARLRDDRGPGIDTIYLSRER